MHESDDLLNSNQFPEYFPRRLGAGPFGTSGRNQPNSDPSSEKKEKNAKREEKKSKEKEKKELKEKEKLEKTKPKGIEGTWIEESEYRAVFTGTMLYRPSGTKWEQIKYYDAHNNWRNGKYKLKYAETGTGGSKIHFYPESGGEDAMEGRSFIPKAEKIPKNAIEMDQRMKIEKSRPPGREGTYDGDRAVFNAEKGKLHILEGETWIEVHPPPEDWSEEKDKLYKTTFNRTEPENDDYQAGFPIAFRMHKNWTLKRWDIIKTMPSKKRKRKSRAFCSEL